MSVDPEDSLIEETEVSRLEQLIAQRVIGDSLHQNNLASPRSAASKCDVHRIPEDWAQDPSNYDAENKIHPFRVFDVARGSKHFATLLAIACEPFAWELIRGDFTTRKRVERATGNSFMGRLASFAKQGGKVAVTPEMLDVAASSPANLREDYQEELFDILRTIGVQKIEMAREALALCAHSYERNTNVIRICRFLSADDRSNLHGRLRYVLMLWEMAECIRRAAETAIGCELPEEDLLVPISRNDLEKETMFGTQRGFDLRESRHHFARRLGVDFGPRAVCYVEGATEEGALKELLHPQGGVEVLDLHGQGITPKLHELLRADQRRRVFTAMLIDGDDEDRVREVRRAAETGLLTIGFAINDPDFEMAIGATPEDLVAAFKNEWERRSNSACPDAAFRRGLENCTSGNQVESLAERLTLPSLKGDRWGAALVTEVFSNADISADSPIPFWNLIFRLFQAQSSAFLWESTVEHMRVDLETGRLVQRTPPTSS